MFFTSAFLIGLLGSLHCVGMCGPLMLVAHAGGTGSDHKWSGLLLYQSGRILTYALLGLLFGFFGWGAHLFGVQREIAIATGALLILMAVFNINAEKHIASLGWLSQLQFKLRTTFGRYLKKNNASARFGLGVLNGLLPCGLVYLAILGAANSPGIGWGMLYMACFGIGTLPLLLTSLLLGQRFGPQLKNKLSWLTGAVLLVAGVLLIWRGGAYQIPAEFWTFQDLAFPPMCHE
jgi:hypothetical protein